MSGGWRRNLTVSAARFLRTALVVALAAQLMLIVALDGLNGACDLVQGWHLGRPMPAAAFHSLVEGQLVVRPG
jgi:EAL domain-containing protein (putative c-di-GMP-specific phosphodiesterase class I)